MIGKIHVGSNFTDCLVKVLGKEKFNWLEIVYANIPYDTADEIAAEFEMFRQLRPRVNQAVCYTILSLSPDETLDDESWDDLIKRYLQEMGFTNNQAIAQKSTVKNLEQVHIVANRVRCDGSVVSDSWQRLRSQKVIRHLEREFGLIPVKCSWETDRHEKSKQQISIEAKSGIPTSKDQIGDKIDCILKNAKTLTDFLDQLSKEGIETRINHDLHGKPRGISYKFENVCMTGSSIGRAYSYPSILKRLENICDLEKDKG